MKCFFVNECRNVQEHLQLQSSVNFDILFAVHFLNAFWYGNKAFPKGSS